ncbi:MAG: YgiQ family radical SAM protein, partial [Bacteroidales bacterium]|nr:YgiQ family radical SAM protein [Bacteroidales bacterium]
MEYSEFLPITLKEMQHLGWTQPDVIIISGDAYVDHPSFGTAIIGRVLESKGLKVAIIPQPNWQDDLRDFKKFGQPRLFFGVTAGNMDSMINRYTANRRLRSDDAYTPGGKSGFRPDYASITYSKILKNLYPDVPVVLGGIEASMRRVTHYDYWSDSVMPPILFDSKADILVYGMGEKPICDLAEVFLKAQSAAEALENLKDIPQIAYVVNSLKDIDKTNCTFLNSHENVLKSKVAFIDNFKIVETESNKHNAKVLIEQVEDKYLIINPHNTLMTTAELDAVYELPFTRMPHPKYKTRGDIPAFNMIRNSVNIHRGCFGGCSFCTISAHQGKFICSRSEESILKEVKQVVGMPYFGGTLSDLGGPSANMYGMGGQNTDLCVKCSKPSCIYPTICNNLVFDHSQLIKLYDDVAKIKGVKNIFIGSGIRYDLFFPKDAAKAKKYKVLDYAKIVIARHTGGRLKVAPEHCSDNVLNLMRKPNFTMF